MKKTIWTVIIIVVFISVGLVLSGDPNYLLENLVNSNSDIYRLPILMDLLLFLICAGLSLVLIIYRFRPEKKLVSISGALGIGGLIGLLYDFIDFAFIKRHLYRCYDWCGIENIFIAAIPIVYLIISGILFVASRFHKAPSSRLN